MMTRIRHLVFCAAVLCSVCAWLPQPVSAQVQDAACAQAPDACATCLSAYVQKVFADTDTSRYGEAADGYLRMLRYAGEATSDSARAVLKRPMAQLALVVDAQLRAEIRAFLAGEAAWPADRVRAWWRQRDPFPASVLNERVIEHLTRVATAERKFSEAGRQDGLDDRGRIYLRFGPPQFETQVPLASSDFVLRSRTLSASDFPQHTHWAYPRISKLARFLFVRNQDNRWRIGEPYDLVPDRLRSAPTGRSRYLIPLLRTLEETYGRLAVYDADLGPFLQDVISTRFAIENGVALTAEAANPSRLVTTINEERRHQERVAERRRIELPASQTSALNQVDPLAVAYRTVRFRESDGSTRVEVLWGLSGFDVLPSEKRQRELRGEGFDYVTAYVLASRHVGYGDAYRTVERTSRRMLVRHRGEADEGPLPPQIDTLRFGGDRFIHLGMEWEARVARYTEAGRLELGPQSRLTVQRADSLRPLVADNRTLELSDLRPMVLPAGAELDQALPYPFKGIRPETPLLLYFEVYNLNFDENDETRYQVEYEIDRRGPVSMLARPPLRRTSGETRYTGSTRTTKEYIELDLTTWDGKGELVITVRITDETTGQTAERVVKF